MTKVYTLFEEEEEEGDLEGVCVSRCLKIELRREKESSSEEELKFDPRSSRGDTQFRFYTRNDADALMLKHRDGESFRSVFPGVLCGLN